MTTRVDMAMLANHYGRAVEAFSTAAPTRVVIANPAPEADLLLDPLGVVPTPDQWGRICLRGAAVGYYFRAINNGVSADDLDHDLLFGTALDQVLADPAVTAADREICAEYPVEDEREVLVGSIEVAKTLLERPAMLHYIGANLSQYGFAELVNPSATRH